MKMADYPLQDRPRERLFRLGPESLTDAELLALILGFGTRGKNVVELAQEILHSCGGLSKIYKDKSFGKIKGIGKGKEAALRSFLELSRRMVYLNSHNKMEVDDFLSYLVADLPKVEEAYVLLLDGRGKVEAGLLLGKGKEEGVAVSFEETLRLASSRDKKRYVLIHVHPSSHLLPSSSDIETTEALATYSTLRGVTLHDHVIVGEGGWFSFQEHGLLP